MFDLVTIGDSTIDNIVVIDDQEAHIQCGVNKDDQQLCLNYADKIPIKKTGQTIGGNAANIAVATSKIGLATAIITELGDDINGNIVKHELERARVDTKLVKNLPGKETRFNVILNFYSERTVLSYYASRNYKLPRLPYTKWIYFTSLGKGSDKIQNQLVKYLKKHPKVKLACNPGSYQMKYSLKKFKDILSFTDIIFLNKQEAAKFIGKKEIKPSLRALHRLGVKIAVITDGEAGSYASDGQNMYFMPTYPLKPQYKAGAGDAYSSGFLSAIIRGQTVPQAMQWGTANAGNVVQTMGAQKGLQTKNGILKTIKKYKKIAAKNI